MKKVYYHILEYSNYGNIGWQGYHSTLEEAKREIDRLKSYFPQNTFEVWEDKSRKEPPITTV